MTESDRANLKFAQILKFSTLPKRKLLINTLIQRGLINVNDETSLYHLFENEFDPLDLSKRVSPLLENLKANVAHAPYAETLTTQLILRVLQQLSRVYSRMSVDAFEKVIPDSLKFEDVEELLMANVLVDQLSVTVDHKARMLVFQDEEMESHRMRSQLTLLAKRVDTVCQMVYPAMEGQKAFDLRLEQTRTEIYNCVRSGLITERKDVFAKMNLIERRKQKEEALKVRNKELKDRKKQEVENARMEAERARLKTLNEKRERERLAKEEQETLERMQRKQREEIAKAEQAVQQAKMADLVKRSGGKKKVVEVEAGDKVKKLHEMLHKDEVDTAALARAKRDADAERQGELKAALKEELKRRDHLVRACRQEEIAARQKNWHQSQIDLMVQRKDHWQKYKEEHHQTHEKSLQEKERMNKLGDFYSVFRNKLVERTRSLKKKQDEQKTLHDKTRKMNREVMEEKKRKDEEEKLRLEREQKEKEEEEQLEQMRQAEMAREQEEEEQRMAKEKLEQQRERSRTGIFGAAAPRKASTTPPQKTQASGAGRFGATPTAAAGGRFGAGGASTATAAATAAATASPAAGGRFGASSGARFGASKAAPAASESRFTQVGSSSKKFGANSNNTTTTSGGDAAPKSRAPTSNPFAALEDGELAAQQAAQSSPQSNVQSPNRFSSNRFGSTAKSKNRFGSKD